MNPRTREAYELETNLAHFTGSFEWHKWSIVFPQCVLTDGAQYLAEKAGAFWLMDIIGSYQPRLLKKGEVFQTWTLKVNPDTRQAVVICDDGNDSPPLVTQEIPWTNFPLDEIKLYASWDGRYVTILLPSEY